MATKIVSVRIESDLLEYIDKSVKDESYFKRSDVINCALRVAVEYHKREGKHLGRGFFPRFGDVIDTLEFECHREHK